MGEYRHWDRQRGRIAAKRRNSGWRIAMSSGLDRTDLCRSVIPMGDRPAVIHTGSKGPTGVWPADSVERSHQLLHERVHARTG